jgi:nucleoid DNA-binding protein
MKKPEMAKRLARRSGLSPAEAADQLDHTVHEILSKLRKRQEAPLAGLGTFTIDGNGRIHFRQQEMRGGE